MFECNARFKAEERLMAGSGMVSIGGGLLTTQMFRIMAARCASAADKTIHFQSVHIGFANASAVYREQLLARQPTAHTKLFCMRSSRIVNREIFGIRASNIQYYIHITEHTHT